MVPQHGRQLGLRGAPVGARGRVDRRAPLRPGHGAAAGGGGCAGRDGERAHRCGRANPAQRRGVRVVIAEVIDTVFTLGWALLAWIAVAAAVGTIVLLTGVALGTWAWRTARRRAAGPPAASRASEPTSAPKRRHAPAWAHTQTHDYED